MPYMRKGGVLHFVGEGVRLGKNVKIWHFAYIGGNAVIGDNVVVGSLCHIDYNVRIGNDVKLQGSVYIPPLTVIGDRVFIGPGVVFTNDPYPMSKKLGGAIVEDDVVIGAGAVIRGGVRIGRGSVIAMGSVITRDVPPYTVVMGVPARTLYSRSEYENKKAEWEQASELGTTP